MRKKLKDKDAELAESRDEIRQRVDELVIKDRVIAERDDVVSELQQQIAQLNANLQSSESTSGFMDDTEVGLILAAFIVLPRL